MNFSFFFSFHLLSTLLHLKRMLPLLFHGFIKAISYCSAKWKCQWKIQLHFNPTFSQFAFMKSLDYFTIVFSYSYKWLVTPDTDFSWFILVLFDFQISFSDYYFYQSHLFLENLSMFSNLTSKKIIHKNNNDI